MTGGFSKRAQLHEVSLTTSFTLGMGHDSVLEMTEDEYSSIKKC
jgi:hypothetical protein